jgi:uncharacterized protein (TIGR03083 family)
VPDPAPRSAYADAAAWFVRTAGLVGDRWDEPGLGEWTVRDLVGHTARALLTVESYLAAPPPAVTLGSSADYLHAAGASLADPAAVAQRGRDAGAALGEDPLSTVRATADRVLAVVADTSDDAVCATPVGGIRLADYLPSRVLELTVHTVDLHDALALEPLPPADAARISLALVGELAVRTGGAPAVLRATTGRAGLPAGFSVL